MAHYEAKLKEKIVVAEIEKLTDAELKAVKNYMALGFEMQPLVKTKKKVEIASEEEKLKNPYSTTNVRKYLAEEGTKAQQEKYWELYNEKTENIYKKDSKDGKHKKGDARVKGHVYTLKWFKETFPGYEDSEWVKKNVKK